MTEMCPPVRKRFSAYLDGDMNGNEMQQVAAHLETCAECRTEFAEWKLIQRALATPPAAPPADLALRLRVALSHESARIHHSRWERVSEKWELFYENTLRPFAVQGTVAVAAILVLVVSFGVLGAVATPASVEANDEPLAGFSTPRYLYSASGLSGSSIDSESPIMVEAQISAQGRVYDYRVLSGPLDDHTSLLLREKMMNAIYQPAYVFGSPVRSHILLTFAGISIHG